MFQKLREYNEGNMRVIEYTADGSAVSHVIRTPIETGHPTPQLPVETMEQKIARLEKQLTEQNIVQMEVLATIFEEIVGGA